jgi:hypothetical protein
MGVGPARGVQSVAAPRRESHHVTGAETSGSWIEKNFELSRKSAVSLYGTWLALPPRHHSPLVVVAPGPIAPVFFGAGSARRSVQGLAHQNTAGLLAAAALLES